MMPKYYSESTPAADVVLPQKLSELISNLSSAGRFPEPWTNFHSMHSELGAMANWIYQLEKNAGETDFELPRTTGGRITTGYMDTEGEQKDVPACPNCRVLLDWFGIEEVPPREHGQRGEQRGENELAETPAA